MHTAAAIIKEYRIPLLLGIVHIDMESDAELCAAEISGAGASAKLTFFAKVYLHHDSKTSMRGFLVMKSLEQFNSAGTEYMTTLRDDDGVAYHILLMQRGLKF
jgi:hypothetical protein